MQSIANVGERFRKNCCMRMLEPEEFVLHLHWKKWQNQALGIKLFSNLTLKETERDNLETILNS